MSKIVNRFVSALFPLDDTKVKLLNLGFLKGRNAANSADVNIVRVNASDKIEFGSLPQAAGTPTVGNDLINKTYFDANASGLPSLTAGSVIFSGGGTTLSQDNADFFWDNTNKSLQIQQPSSVTSGIPAFSLTIDPSGLGHGKAMAVKGNPGGGVAIYRDDGSDISWLELRGGKTNTTGGTLYVNGNNSGGGDAGGVQVTLGLTSSSFDVYDTTQSNQLFSVANSGAVSADTGAITTTGAGKINMVAANVSGLAASSIVTTDASKNLSTTSTIPVVNGGTNSTATPTAGGVAYGTGSAYGFTSAGTAGQYLQSTGTSTPTWANISSSIGSTGYFGAFQDNFAQTIASTTTSYAINLHTIDINNGVTIANDLSGNPTKIVFANAGTYSTTFSIQFANSDTSATNLANVWLRVNGSDVAESNTQITIPTKHAGIDGSAVMTVNFMNTIAAGDYLQLVWSANSTQVYMAAFGTGASPTIPATPSIILTTQELAQIGLGYAGLTSSTSMSVGIGSKTFTTNLDASATAFAVGARVRVAYTTTPANFMEGIVTAFSGSSMTVNVDTIGGATGPFSAWNISISANASTLGTVGIANGGTGQTTAANAFNALSPITTAGDLILGTGVNTAGRLAIGANGTYLKSNGTTAAWSTSPTITPNKEKFTLTATDITNQYIDLAQVAIANSIDLVTGGLVQIESVDYTVSLTGGVGGKTRLTFAGDLASAGASALASGEIVVVKYAY